MLLFVIGSALTVAVFFLALWLLPFQTFTPVSFPRFPGFLRQWNSRRVCLADSPGSPRVAARAGVVPGRARVAFVCAAFSLDTSRSQTGARKEFKVAEMQMFLWYSGSGS